MEITFFFFLPASLIRMKVHKHMGFVYFTAVSFRSQIVFIV